MLQKLPAALIDMFRPTVRPNS